jgi:hypothetical protein
MPQIGELTPRLWLASGFGGHGLNTTAMAGNIIARAIDEGDDTWRLFLPFELVWSGGVLGRAAAKGYYTWSHLRERGRARQARRREAEYRRSEARQAAAPEAKKPDSLAKRAEALLRRRAEEAAKAAAPVTDAAAEPAPAPEPETPAPRYDWRNLLDPRRAAPPRQE